MRQYYAASLRCPTCHRDGTLGLRSDASNALEIREGSLHCGACDSEFPVHRGVAGLLAHPPQAPGADTSGFERLAEYLQLAGRETEFLRTLPDLPDEYWHVRARSMHQLLTTVPFQPGETVLDVGAGTCWAAYHFAERGLQAVALDVATPELRGLYTADALIADGRVYFERVLASMEALPLASSSVNYVFCFEVLHACDDAALRRTMAEFFRVLRPGGRLLMLNERVRALRPTTGAPEDGGPGHGHAALRYRWEAARAGFFTDPVEPHHLPFFGDADLVLEPGTPPLSGLGAGLGFALRANGAARRVYLEWLNDVAGGVGLNLIATKPSRFVGRGEAVRPPERLLRTAAAAGQLQWARWRHRTPPRFPRTPEQVQAALLARSGAAGVAATAAPPVLVANTPEVAPSLNGRAASTPVASRPGPPRSGSQTIVFTGNCQTQGIADAVRALLPGASTPAFHLWGMDRPDAQGRLDLVREALAGADAWVRMPLGTNALIEDAAPAGTRVIEIPSLTFAAFHPDIVIATTTTGTYFRGLADYHSAIALWAWRRGLEPAEAAALFQPEVMAALGYDRYWAPAVRAVRDEFAASSLDWVPFWSRLKREGVFMHTINHPRLAAVALQGKAVAACLTGRDSVWAEPLERYADDHLREVVWPVYPFVGQALGLAGSYHWRYGDTHFGDVLSWAEATWSRYEGTAPETVLCERLDHGSYDAVLEPWLAASTRTSVPVA